MPSNDKSKVRGCACHGAVLYELDVPPDMGAPGRSEWFTSKRDACARRADVFRDMDKPGGHTAVRRKLPIHRVTLTARLTPKNLALALLNGDGYVAQREMAVV